MHVILIPICMHNTSYWMKPSGGRALATHCVDFETEQALHNYEPVAKRVKRAADVRVLITPIFKLGIKLPVNKPLGLTKPLRRSTRLSKWDCPEPDDALSELYLKTCSHLQFPQ